MSVSLPHGLRLPLDLADPSFCAHKFEVYAWLREHQPVVEARYSMLSASLVTRYADCELLLRDPRFRRQVGEGSSWWTSLVPRSWLMLFDSMLQKDDPDHKRLRGFVTQAFSPREMRRLEPATAQIAEMLLDGMDAKARAGEPVDLVADFGLPLPALVMGELLGIEAEDTETFVGFVQAIVDSTKGSGWMRGLAWDLPRAVRFVDSVIAKKRVAPGDDLLSTLIHMEEQGDRLSPDELAGMVLVLIIGGYETTAHLISSGTVELLQQPDALDALKADPARMPVAVEEMLRMVSPAQTSDRVYPTEDVELSGVRIPKNQALVACVGAANRDPRAFEDPDTFDISRRPNRHLGFGMGAHYCVGAALARMEARVALDGLLARFPGIGLAVAPSDLVIAPAPALHHYAAVPVTLG